MNRRILTIVLCALVVSACASFLVYRVVSAHATTETQPHAVQVVVAARDLQVGTLIRDADLGMAAWAAPVPKGAVLKRAGIVNRGVASAIYEGEPITESRLSPAGSGGGLAATIPPGMRACAVRVNEVVGVAGFVVPGMRVDVLITGVPPGGDARAGAEVKTLLQNIQVLSAGINFQKDTEGKPEPAQVVNLLVTPDQAENLSLAGNETKIQLILRNPMDTQISRPPGTSMSGLFGSPRAPDPAPAAAPAITREPKAAVATPVPVPYVIHVTNGATHSEVKFNPIKEAGQ
jgi:pilus assembly protein CpaB